MKGLMITLAVVCAVAWSVPQAEGKSFYLKNGEEIEYQRSWQKDGLIYLLINRDTLLQVAPEEADLKRSKVAAQARTSSRKPAKRADDAGRSEEGKKDAGYGPGSVAAAPASAVAGRNRNSRGATVAAPKGYKPATPAVQAELAEVYGRFYAAVRAGDISEQLRYATGKQRKSVEALDKASAEGKELVLMTLRSLPETYVVTGASIAADKKSATLTTVRKSPVYKYEMVDNGWKETPTVSYKNVTGVVKLLKESGEWKVESIQES